MSDPARFATCAGHCIRLPEHDVIGLNHHRALARARHWIGWPVLVRRYQQGCVMLKHLLIEVVGHLSGLNDAQLEQIERSLPATKALIDLLAKAHPIIEQAEALYNEAQPLIDQAKKEWQA